MSFNVVISPEAQDDLTRLFSYLLDRAETLEDLDQAEDAMLALRSCMLHQLAVTPYSFRKAGKSPTRRELIVPFGASGYVVLYEIASASSVVVLAVRHQREEDYH